MLSQCLIQQLFVLSKGFTHLTFDAVTVDGVFEVLLGNADENLNRNAGLLAVCLAENGSQRIDGHPLAAVTEELIYQSCAADMLPFRKPSAVHFS